MIVTVQEAKMKIENLQAQYDDFLKLQNYAMCIDLNKSGKSTYLDSPEKNARKKILGTIKEEAKTLYSIREMCSIGCELCKSEIERIENIIGNSKIDI